MSVLGTWPINLRSRTSDKLCGLSHKYFISITARNIDEKGFASRSSHHGIFPTLRERPMAASNAFINSPPVNVRPA